MRSDNRYEKLIDKKVIFIDDDPFFSQIIESICEHYQIDLLSCFSKIDLITKVGETDLLRYDMVISDVNLKDGTGYEVTEWVRGITSELPVLLVSGALNAYEFEHYSNIFKGMDCLSKPFSVQEILEKILASLTSGQSATCLPRQAENLD